MTQIRTWHLGTITYQGPIETAPAWVHQIEGIIPTPPVDRREAASILTRAAQTILAMEDAEPEGVVRILPIKAFATALSEFAADIMELPPAIGGGA